MQKINFYLLRGLSRESAHWGTFPKDLLHKIPNSSVILMDLPGFGALNQMDSPTQIDLIVDILRNKFFKKEGTNIFIASSLATLVALKWAQRLKDDFQGLVLLSPSVKDVCKFTERIKPRAWFDGLLIMLHPSVKLREKKLLKINSNMPFNGNNNFDKWIEIQKKRPYKVKNLYRQLLAGSRFKLSDESIEVPILISGSNKDKLVASNCFIQLKIKLGADLAMHDHAGHSLTLEASDWLIDKIKSWQHAHQLV